jgi:2-polyprenyl-3-methyl-5-hydroxy-6-metoxy-1,4-benzoquinol methylase
MADRFRIFYEVLGEKYPEEEFVYRTLSGQIRKKWIMHKLETLPPGNLVDCGCNSGLLSRNWRRGEVFGVDLSYAVLHRGKATAPRTIFVQADLRDLGIFKQGSFDNAMACEVVEHLDQPGKFFRYIHHAMKKGGHILVTTPNYTRNRPKKVELGIIRSFGITTGTSDSTYLHTAYRPDELARMAREAGFTVIEQGSFEHELRGWLKPLTIMETAFTLLSERFFASSRFKLLFHTLINRMELNAFTVLDTFLLARVVRRIFKQGRRSYILAVK